MSLGLPVQLVDVACCDAVPGADLPWRWGTTFKYPRSVLMVTTMHRVVAHNDRIRRTPDIHCLIVCWDGSWLKRLDFMISAWHKSHENLHWHLYLKGVQSAWEFGAVEVEDSVFNMAIMAALHHRNGLPRFVWWSSHSNCYVNILRIWIENSGTCQWNLG